MHVVKRVVVRIGVEAVGRWGRRWLDTNIERIQVGVQQVDIIVGDSGGKQKRVGRVHIWSLTLVGLLHTHVVPDGGFGTVRQNVVDRLKKV